jgi:hypothetical protein
MMKLQANEPTVARRRSVVATAKAAGLLAGDNAALGARIPHRLVSKAKERSGISSTTELVEYALAKVALEDDFGSKLVARKGTIPADIKLEL